MATPPSLQLSAIGALLDRHRYDTASAGLPDDAVRRGDPEPELIEARNLGPGRLLRDIGDDVAQALTGLDSNPFGGSREVVA